MKFRHGISLENIFESMAEPKVPVQVSLDANRAIPYTGTLTDRPAPNANGTARVQVVARDNGGTANGGSDTSSTATFTITVTPVNDAPVALNDTATVRRNGSVTIPVLANDSDVDGDTLSSRPPNL
jgi:hypothetical protein